MTKYFLLATVGILTTNTTATAERDLVSPQRDPDHAFTMSAGGVAGSLALAGAGAAISMRSKDAGATLVVMGAGSLLFTPSLGHSYGGDRILTTGMKLRLGALASLLVTLPAGYLLAVAAGCGTEDQDGCMGSYVAISGAFSIALFLGGVVHDLATVRDETRRHNAGGLSARLAPTFVPTANGRAAAGLGVVGSF